MAHKWREVRKTLSPEREARVAQKVKEELKRMPLYELREARHLTQAVLAKTLGVNQAAISKIEKRTDTYISTLRSYVEAMGGSLEIRAKFADGEVSIDQFEEPEEKAEKPKPRRSHRYAHAS